MHLCQWILKLVCVAWVALGFSAAALAKNKFEKEIDKEAGAVKLGDQLERCEIFDKKQGNPVLFQ